MTFRTVRIGGLTVKPASPVDGALLMLIGTAALDRRELEELRELINEALA